MAKVTTKVAVPKGCRCFAKAEIFYKLYHFRENLTTLMWVDETIFENQCLVKSKLLQHFLYEFKGAIVVFCIAKYFHLCGTAESDKRYWLLFASRSKSISEEVRPLIDYLHKTSYFPSI